MADSNFIKPMLESWNKCKEWIENVYPEKLFELEHDLTNVGAIGYSEEHGTGQDESMRRSTIIDKMNLLEKKKKRCQDTIDFCENIIEQVKPQYREVFRYRYETHATVAWIVYNLGFSRSRVYEILNEETKRIASC